MIKAVIFDLNGIFVQTPKLSERLERDYGVEHEAFLPKLREIMNKVRQPNAGPAWTYWKEFFQEQKLNFTESEFWTFWFGAEKISDEMIVVAKKLKQKGVKVFILSNNFKERSLYYEHYPWVHEAVDKIYFSWQTGFVKPDPRAWTNILEENGLKPGECIYFDDSERNVEAAESVGIKSFLFTTEDELERIVNELIK